MGGAMKKGETRTFTCSNSLKGRYVFIVNNVNDYLTLCEVQVFAVRGMVYRHLIMISCSRKDIYAPYVARVLVVFFNFISQFSFYALG